MRATPILRPPVAPPPIAPAPPAPVKLVKARHSLLKPDVLVAARKAKGMSQTELAIEIGTSQGVISQFELGKRDISAEMITLIAVAMDVTVDDLVAGLVVKEAKQAATPRRERSEVGAAPLPSGGVAKPQPPATFAHPAGVKKVVEEVEAVELIDVFAAPDLYHASKYGAEHHCFCEGDEQCVFHAALAKARVDGRVTA